MKKILPIMKIVLPIIIAVVALQIVNIPESHAAPPASGGGMYYTVQYGDTLFSIGRRYGVNPYHIAEVNGLDNPDCIYAGQVLYIPSGYSYGQYPRYDRGYNQYPRYDRGYNQYPRYDRGYNQYPRYDRGYNQYPSYGHGYDYTGYYYYNNYPNYRRYSYTCGYYYNCY